MALLGDQIQITEDSKGESKTNNLMVSMGEKNYCVYCFVLSLLRNNLF